MPLSAANHGMPEPPHDHNSTRPAATSVPRNGPRTELRTEPRYDSRSDAASGSWFGRWRPVEALGSWLVPGLGHVLLGQTRRGLIVGVTIVGLWLGGLLIGGVGVVNRDADRPPLIWIGQYVLAPSLLIDLAHRYHVVAPDAGPLQGYTAPRPMLAYRPAFGRANEHGVLFTSVAGLLNLMVILDVLYLDDKTLRRWRAERARRRRGPSGPGGRATPPGSRHGSAPDTAVGPSATAGEEAA